jgi:tetratricopeptide (TPR) repeat protein
MAKLARFFDRAESLVEEGRPDAALDLLAPLLESYPHVADLHYYVGYAHFEAGDLWAALDGYEQALALSPEPARWLPLSSIYLEVGMKVHALHAFRRVLQNAVDGPTLDHVERTVAALEHDVAAAARQLDVSTQQLEEGLRYLEQGQRALHHHDYEAAIAANRQAIKQLGDWPPPHNNLALALFEAGRPQDAIATERRVLSQSPQNVQALSNAIRFLVWTGQEEAARALWPQLQAAPLRDLVERYRIAEAAAALQEDEVVYQVLKPLDRLNGAGERAGLPLRMQWFLAVAELNTDRPAAARLASLRERMPRAAEFLTALEAGQPGPGWAERFSYFHITELVPPDELADFVAWVERQEELAPARFRHEVAHFVRRYPQLVPVAERMIWEECQPEVGLPILAAIATPPAFVALRRFAFSQAGGDEARANALLLLAQAGQIDSEEIVRVWRAGEWREIQLRAPGTAAHEPGYTRQARELLAQGLRAFQAQELERAETLFQRMLELEPQAKEAYNNLGTIYARREEHEQAQAMFQAALEIDPAYVFPAGNMVFYLLEDKNLEAARATLEPLKDVQHFHPQELSFYSYVRACVLMEEGHYGAARKALALSLQVAPDYEPAQRLLQELDTSWQLQTDWASFLEERRARQRAKRARLQSRLTTSEPALVDLLALYNKDTLQEMARHVLPQGGWSALRKADLIRRLAEGLQDAGHLAQLLAGLKDKERQALRQVLGQGGAMAWQQFDARYGNDLDESPFWQHRTPETLMGRLRLHGLLGEATVDQALLILIPVELRQPLRAVLESE